MEDHQIGRESMDEGKRIFAEADLMIEKYKHLLDKNKNKGADEEGKD